MSKIVQDCQPLVTDFTAFCHDLLPEEAFFACFLDQVINAYQTISAFVSALPLVNKLLSDHQLKKMIFQHIKQDLLPVITKTCVYELQEAKTNGYLTEATSDARFRQFVELLKESENIQAILNKYPVLAQLLKTYLKQYIQSMKQFFDALNSDYLKMRLYFGIPQSSQLHHIYKAGDRHRQSSSVLILEFIDEQARSNVQKIVYKPRSLAIDVTYNHFIDWLNHETDFGFRYSKTLNHETYGWCEFVHDESCQNEKEVSQFYYRLGGLLAVAHLLNGNLPPLLRKCTFNH